MLRSYITWKWRLAIVAIAAIAYAPCINNGFIADDFVNLNRVEIIKTNPAYLIEVTPEPFRLTSYIVLGVLKGLFGYDYRFFYAVSILLHAINSMLLAELALELTGLIDVSLVAAVLFAVFQVPQEAVMWIGAMNESLLGLFVLSTLLLWVRGRYRWALATYSLALISKESGIVILLLVLLIEVYRGKAVYAEFWRRYLWLLIPTSVFAVAFLLTLSKNFMVNNRIHAVGWHALIVLPNSIHRLLWPWGYILVLLMLISKTSRPANRTIVMTAALLASAFVPYIFVTNTYNIPSRHHYLASAVLAVALASNALRLRAPALRNLFLASFVIVDIAYLWTRKDSQMERRAAPTTALLEELKKRQPGPVRLIGFEYAPASDMAKGAAITLPGWHWNDIELIPPADRCTGCTILEWHPADHRYIQLPY